MFFAQACVGDNLNPATGEFNGYELTVTVDPRYDADSVYEVLRSLYVPEFETNEWLKGKKWMELLPIYEVAHLFHLNEMMHVTYAMASDAICSIEDFDDINTALEIFKSPTLQDFVSSRFSAEIGGLRRGLEEHRKEQVRTMRLLRDPFRRHEVSEQQYQSFLDAVKSSSWAQQVKDCADE
ncbi:hypothetical protein TI39_contig447g00007 [Zymoseptoria brevis]|uniref:Uncharacterized protein n=1 Tax=Zymoseptoria brevis TaxID=1047168 RepID=A0A0F4GL90_9PEZI|nr:hypothetical protein TI39_contig447g00007 [Zymoseptoria brevis]